MSEPSAEADFDAVMAEITGAEPDTAEPDQTVDTSDASADDSEPAAEPAAADEPEALTAAEAAAAKLIEAGDLDGALKRLGVDPKLVKVDRRQFFAMRKGLADAKAKERAGEAAKGEAAKLRSEAEKLYGPIAAGFQAMRAGDGARLRAAIELLAEDSWDNVAAAVQRGNKPLDPATAEVMRLRAEIAQRDKAQTDAQRAAQVKAHETQQIAKLEAQVAKTPLAKVPGAAKSIFDRVRASYDGVGYSLSVQDAYRAVKAEAEAVAKAFGAKPGKPAARVLPERRATTPESLKLSTAEREEAAFQATIREAEAAAKQAVRAVKRGSR